MIVHVYDADKEVYTIEVYSVGGGSVLFKDEKILADKPQVYLEKKYERDFLK